MKKYVVTLMVALGLSVVLAAGCATTSKGLSDEEQVKKQMQEAVQAIQAKNYDVFSKNVSESFYSSAVGDRNDLLKYLKNADEMGFLDGIEIDLSQAEIVIEGTTGTVDPVYADGVFGSLTLNFEGAKENGVWVITGLEPGY